MDLRQELWDVISKTVGVQEDTKRNLYHSILRLIETSRTSVGKKLGVTIMTQEASLAGDNTDIPPIKPKSI